MKSYFRVGLTVTVLLISLLIGSTQSLSANTILDGAPCAKVGKVKNKDGLTFRCTKSGKKLSWRISKQTSNATPVPTPAPTPSATGTAAPGSPGSPEPSKSTMPSATPSPQPSRTISAALRPDEVIAREIFTAFRKPAAQTDLFKYHFSPNIDAKNELVSFLMQDLVRSQRYWEELGIIFDQKIQVAFATEKDQDWWNALKASIGVNCNYQCDDYVFKNFKSQPYMGYAGASNQTEDSQNGLHIFFFVSSELHDERDIYWARVMAPHEFVHLVQFQLTPGRVMGRYACWYIEGLARFYERASQFDNPYPNGYSYRKFKREELDYFAYLIKRQDGYKSVSEWKIPDYLDFLIKNQAPSSEACLTLRYGYKLGWPLSEKFYMDFGPKSFVSLLKSVNKTRDWDKSFVETTGISHRDWLLKSAIPYLIEQSQGR